MIGFDVVMVAFVVWCFRSFEAVDFVSTLKATIRVVVLREQRGGEAHLRPRGHCRPRRGILKKWEQTNNYLALRMHVIRRRTTVKPSGNEHLIF